MRRKGFWKVQGLLAPEEGWNAEAVAAVNNLLEMGRQVRHNKGLIQELRGKLAASCCD